MMAIVRRSAVSFCMLLSLMSVAYLAGCNGGSSPTPTTAAAAPAIGAIAPSRVTAGSGSFTLGVTGSGFVTGSLVKWNGSTRTTTYGSATQISAAILASDVATAGTAQVTVVNPDGQSSAATVFTINALPVATSLSPSTAVAGGASFTLTVNGSGYRTGAQIEWAGSAIAATTVVSGTQVTASIPASYIANAGNYSVDVLNTDTGDRSGALTFTVTPAQPTLTSLSPSTVVAGSGGFTLTVNGSGFTQGATVAWAGSARTTTFVSSTQLTAAIPASDVASATTVSVDVAQSSVRSTNQLTFTVSAVVPTITSLSPATAIAGSAGFNLTVNGTGFTNAASVTFNGSAKTTTFVSATQLTAAITSSDLSTPGNVSVDVVQGGVHAASTLTFTITAAAPVITSLSPSSVVAGSPATTLTVNGTGFVASSVVDWSGSALATSYVSATQLTATIPAANLTSAATPSITVVNPGGSGGTSTGVTFTVTPPVSGSIVQLLTPDYQTGGLSKNNNYGYPPTLSQDGRYAGFSSLAADLVAGDTNGLIDAFVRDTCAGPSAPGGCVPATTRMSIDPPTNGNGPGGAYSMTVLDTTGRYAAFDTAGQGATHFRDNCFGASGCTPGVTIVSYLPGASGASYSKPQACCSVVSPDGRYVLFSAIVSNSSGGTDTGIFVRDTCTGATACTPGTTRVVTGTGAQPPHQPFQADISSGGRYVLFRTAGNDIIPTYSSNLHLFEEDTCIGAPAPCTVSYTPIDVRADGTEGSDTEDQQTSLSKDGRYAVFSSTDGQIVSGGTLASLLNVYVRDTCVGAASGCVPATTLVSADPVAQTKGYRSFLGFRSVSEHGRYVAFTQDMLDTTVNSIVEIIRVRDTCIGAGSGCVPSFSTVSNDPNGTFGVAHTNFTEPSISADGHYVVFVNANGQVYLATTGY